MEYNYFYKNKNFIFAFPEQIPKLDKNSKKILVLKTLEDAKNFQKLSDLCEYSAVLSNNANTIAFWVNKKIDFIINPFDFKGKAFDKNTFSILLQNKIFPIIIIDKIITDNKDNQIQLFKHLFAFNKLCKKYKLPLILLSKDEDASYAFYNVLGYNDLQAKRFLSGFYEEKD